MSNQDDEKETELNFTEHWSSFNVQQEVLQGERLRQEKLGTKKTEHNYEYANIGLNLSSDSNRRANFSTLSHRKRKVRKAQKKWKKLLKHQSKDRQCPLRIIELAEPRKRQCLNVWKNSGHILPDYMIERLKNHVMDEKPVVKISDAVRYFKNRRAFHKKSKPKLGSKQYHQLKHIMMLSGIFGYRIQQILMKPLNILLSKELDTINNVVRDDIKRILRTKNKCKDINKKDKILADISMKVTIWIANILEEASYKQLLEQLNELEEKEGPVLDIIDEIVDNAKIFSSSSSSSSTEFSKSNNFVTPSLSSIDDKERSGDIFKADEIQKTDIVNSNNIANQESQSNDKIESVEQLSAINDSIDMKHHIKNMLEEKLNDFVDRLPNAAIEFKEIPAKLQHTPSTGNNINQLLSNEDKSLDNMSRNVLLPNLDNEILYETKNLDETENNDEIIQNSNIETAWGKTNLRTSIEYDILSGMPINNDDNNTNALDDDKINNENIPSDAEPLNNKEIIEGTLEITNELDSAEKTVQKQESDDKLERNSMIIDEQTNNEEEETEEGNKKVKFSDINMDYSINNIEEFNTYLSHPTSNEIKKPIDWKRSKEYIFSHYNVAPPNQNLLSFVDEIWPAENLTPLLRATESVIKSVTSLGNIAELEEYSMVSVNDSNLINNKRSDSTLVKFVNEQENANCKEDLEMLEKYFVEVSTDNKQHDPSNKEMSMRNDQKSDIIKRPNEMSQINTKEMVYDCGDVNVINCNVSMQLELKNTGLENVSEVTCHKSVTVQTSDKKVQSNFETNLIYGQLKRDRNDIRKWCEGLENVTKNLELWATWIDNVCCNVIGFKYEGIYVNKM